MKLAIVLTTLFALPLFGISGNTDHPGIAETSLSENAFVTKHQAPQGVAPCGLTVDLTVFIDEVNQSISVQASGTPGQSCVWLGMIVEFSMRDTATGNWHQLLGYEGEANNWGSEEMGTAAYDKYKAKVVGYDTHRAMAKHACSHKHSAPQEIHSAMTKISGIL